MAWADEDERARYRVVVNHEEQYSIWPLDWENALGWRDVGKSGTKAECLAHIESVWQDMRPLSLRKCMDEIEGRPAPELVAESDPGPDLVTRLSQGDHRIEAGLHPVRTAAALRERIEMGYVHVRFVDTQGGTEIGIRLDAPRLDLSKADFESAAGKVVLVGSLVLDDAPLECTAVIELATLAGVGHLASRN